jgi:hypothetical protein
MTVSSSNNEAIPTLTIRDMVSLATRQLGGTSRPSDNGYTIELRDYNRGTLLALELFKSPGQEGGVNLKITSSHVRGNINHSIVNLLNLEHLYLTWETKGMISFCFAGDGRYSLVNITRENGVLLNEDVDRRNYKREEELSESEQLARSQRRTFYHIGASFEEAIPHDPNQPIMSSGR